ncbi:hypothetical protein [Streptomyces sp. NPDC055400]
MRWSLVSLVAATLLTSVLARTSHWAAARHRAGSSQRPEVLGLLQATILPAPCRALHWRTLKPLAGGLHPKSVGAVVTKSSEDAERGVKHTGHSARRGDITEAARAGIDRKVIARQSGHRPGSPTLEGYIEEGGMWEDNALIGIGL